MSRAHTAHKEEVISIGEARVARRPGSDKTSETFWTTSSPRCCILCVEIGVGRLGFELKNTNTLPKKLDTLKRQARRNLPPWQLMGKAIKVTMEKLPSLAKKQRTKQIKITLYWRIDPYGEKPRQVCPYWKEDATSAH